MAADYSVPIEISDEACEEPLYKVGGAHKAPTERGQMPTWLSDDEKYALIAMEVNIDQSFPLREFVPGYWAWTGAPTPIPEPWRGWLGTVRTEAIEDSTLVLLCKTASKTTHVLDAENDVLKRRVWGFYIGLLLSSSFTLHRPPVQLTGAQKDGERDVREQSELDVPALSLIRRFPDVKLGEVEEAARLGRLQEQLVASPPSGGAWRFFRALTVYVEARQTQDVLDRGGTANGPGV